MVLNVSEGLKRNFTLFSIVLAYLALFLMSDYRNFQFTMVCIYVIVLFGCNLLIGYNGQISLGQSAFYAMGAYLSVMMIKYWGVPYYLTIFPAGVLCFIVGYLIGFPALRLKGPFLGIATLSLVVVMPQVLNRFEFITGGRQGLQISKPEVPFGLPLTQDQWLYFLCLSIMIVLFFLGRNFIKSDSGKAIMAIRDNPTAAAAMGINLATYKTLTFGISAFYAGVAGALAGIVIHFISPDMFTVDLALSFVIGITIGGLASIIGPIFGALFIFFVPTITSNISNSAHLIIYGFLIILIIQYFPNGFSGLFKLIFRKLKIQF